MSSDDFIELCKDNFEENCGLDTIQPQAIAAALFYLLKISMLSTKSIACTIFGITENQLNDALLLLEKRRNYEDS